MVTGPVKVLEVPTINGPILLYIPALSHIASAKLITPAVHALQSTDTTISICSVALLDMVSQ